MGNESISYDIDKLHQLLGNISTKLQEVKFESFDFGLEGNSSGLNTFVYSYVKLANFLVEYRRFVRNDILEVCNSINNFIQLDATAATFISKNSIPSFEEFMVNVDNTADTIVSQTIPPTSISSFIVNRLDTENMTSKYTSLVLPLTARLVELKILVKAFTTSDALTGDTASAMKNYWTEVHIPIIESIDTVLWALNDYMIAYGTDLRSCVNDDLYYVWLMHALARV